MGSRPDFRSHLTPPAVAIQLGVKPQKILDWIRSGELRAVNLAAVAHGQRPRWRISPADLDQFLATRRAVASVPRVRRSRRPPPDVIKFF